MNDAIMAQLDRNLPGWWIDWATQDDLRDLTHGYSRKSAVRERVARRLFHPILHAALCADLITETKAPRMASMQENEE